MSVDEERANSHDIDVRVNTAACPLSTYDMTPASAHPIVRQRHADRTGLHTFRQDLPTALRRCLWETIERTASKMDLCVFAACTSPAMTDLLSRRPACRRPTRPRSGHFVIRVYTRPWLRSTTPTVTPPWPQSEPAHWYCNWFTSSAVQLGHCISTKNT